mgnify:FL=1
MRTDFRFDTDRDNNIVWMIWPEFENDVGAPCTDADQIADSGTATMWVINETPEYRAMLRERLKPGARGALVAGAMIVAEAEVVELLGKELA